MSPISLTSIALFFGAGLTSAQFISSVSHGCQSTLANLLASPDASCLNPSAFLSLAMKDKDTSIISTINTWATGLCSTNPCTNDAIAAVVTNITTGCSAEFSQLTGTNSFSVPQLIQVAQMAYPTGRKIVCLQNTSSNQLCVTETLTNIENLLGTISMNNAANIVSEIQSMDTVPANITCTDCVKEAYNILLGDFPNIVSQFGITPALQEQCGSNFTDDQNPSEIQQFSAMSTPNGGLAIAPLNFRGGTTAIELLVLSVVFAALA